MRSLVARGLQALQSLTALQALEMMRSVIAPVLQVLKSLTALQALELGRSLVLLGIIINLMVLFMPVMYSINIKVQCPQTHLLL